MEKLFADRGVDVAVIQRRLNQVAKAEGLPFSERTMTFNSRLAQELGKWAESQGKGDQFHDAAFRVCFVDGKNIAKTDVLIDLAKSVGLPPEEAGHVLETRAFKEAVDQDWSYSKRMMVSVIPTMAINEKLLAGAQKYEIMEKFLIENNVKRRGI